MAERKSIAVGVDFDGVLMKKASKWDLPRRTTKMGLDLVPGAKRGLKFLNGRPDVDVLGVFTVRPEWLRRGQTVRQIRRHELPVNNVVHTPNSSKEKVRALLDMAEGAVNKSSGDRIPLRHRKQTVLIDDSVEKVVEGARELATTSPEHADALSRFTLVAFDPKQRYQVQGLIVPGIVHIVSMQNWGSIGEAIDSVKHRTA